MLLLAGQFPTLRLEHHHWPACVGYLTPVTASIVQHGHSRQLVSTCQHGLVFHTWSQRAEFTMRMRLLGATARVHAAQRLRVPDRSLVPIRLGTIARGASDILAVWGLQLHRRSQHGVTVAVARHWRQCTMPLHVQVPGRVECRTRPYLSVTLLLSCIVFSQSCFNPGREKAWRKHLLVDKTCWTPAVRQQRAGWHDVATPSSSCSSHMLALNSASRPARPAPAPAKPPIHFQ
jgi:hypothetical protein